jgi:hypothetical protein
MYGASGGEGGSDEEVACEATDGRVSGCLVCAQKRRELSRRLAELEKAVVRAARQSLRGKSPV